MPSTSTTPSDTRTKQAFNEKENLPPTLTPTPLAVNQFTVFGRSTCHKKRGSTKKMLKLQT